MKKFLIIASVFVLSLSCNSPKTLDLSIMTYNIRYGLANDGENSWEFRKEFLASQIAYYHPTIFGTQEGLPFQVNYLNESLTDYAFVGTDRDGNGKGEYTAIFYDENILICNENKTLWLAIDQTKHNKSWDAAYPRIYTFALFEHIDTKKQFWVLNTHLDHIGKTARIESVKIILAKIKEINQLDLPLFFIGDLNALPESDVVKNIKKYLNDSKDFSTNKPFGNKGTFNNFEFNKPITKRIDYIFFSKNNSITIEKYAVLSNSNNLKYPSDHFPVIISLSF